MATATVPGALAAGGRVVARDSSSGGIYVAGEARVSAKASKIMVVKYDAAGVQQWKATYAHGGSGTQTAVDGAVDKAGDFVVLCAVSGARTRGDWAVLEYRPDGTRAWATTIAGTGRGNDVPSRLALSSTGAIYAAGGLCVRHDGLDAAVVKLSSAGTVAWRRSIAGPGDGADRFSALGLDGTGRVFCAGTRGSAKARGADCLMAAYSPAGRRLWAATWGGAAHLRDGVSDLVVTTAGKAYAVGWFGTKSGSCATIRQYNAAGSFVWQGKYATKGDGRYRFLAAALLPRGGVVATGDLVDAATGNSNIVTIGFASHGPSLWQQIWDTPGTSSGYSKDQARSVAVDAAGRVFVCGCVPAGSAAVTDFAVLAYTATGAKIWSAPQTWNGGAGRAGACALVPAPDGVVVTGQSRVVSSHLRMATVELPY
jgi:hypothetical protein